MEQIKIYNLTIKGSAKKQLKKLPSNVSKKLWGAIKSLTITPRPNGYKKLTNSNLYRIKEGVYRIVYDILKEEVVISIITVGHRRDVYKKLKRAK